MFSSYCSATWGPAPPTVCIRISAVVLSARDPHSIPHLQCTYRLAVKAYQMKAGSPSLTMLSQMRIQSEQTSRRRDENLPYQCKSVKDNAEATLQKHKCEYNRGKLTWQGFAFTFPLSINKTNINKWANTHLTRLTPQEHLIYRTIKMIKSLAFLIGSRGTLGII